MALSSAPRMVDLLTVVLVFFMVAFEQLSRRAANRLRLSLVNEAG